jgi:hypothetical protein
VSVSDEKPDNENPDGNNPDGENPPQPAPPRFWGSPEPQKPVDPSEFGASSGSSNEPEDTTPAWLQSPPPQAAPPTNEPVSQTPPPAGDWQNAMPPPQGPPSQEPPGGSGQFNNVPVFQPPSAGGRKRSFELRPFTVADILDNTFQLFKANWKQLAVATLVYAVPAGIVTAVTDAVDDSDQDQNFLTEIVPYSTGFSSDATGSDLVIGMVAALLSLAITFLLQPLVQGIITRLVAANFVGRDMGAKEAFNGVKHLWLTFIGATILTTLAMIGGLIVFLVGFVIAAVLFSIVIPIIAIEEEGVFNAMGRSWALVKRAFWRYLGTWIVVFILTVLIALAVGLIPGILASVLYDANVDPLAFVVAALGNTLGELVVFPISAIAATLIYFDARVRFEGFDVQLMAARLPQAPNTSPNRGPGNV